MRPFFAMRDEPADQPRKIFRCTRRHRAAFQAVISDGLHQSTEAMLLGRKFDAAGELEDRLELFEQPRGRFPELFLLKG
jgi:hypothetical protein